MQRYTNKFVECENGGFVKYREVEDLKEQHRVKEETLNKSWILRYQAIKKKLYAKVYTDQNKDLIEQHKFEIKSINQAWTLRLSQVLRTNLHSTDNEFKVCFVCVGKVMLCDACIHNRMLISELKKKVKEHRQVEEKHEFQECVACAAKPGMPILCSACVHNRMLISELKKKVKETVDLRGTLLKKNRGIMTWGEIIDAIDFENLDSVVPCRIVYRDSAGNVMYEQSPGKYTIINGTIMVNIRRP